MIVTFHYIVYHDRSVINFLNLTTFLDTWNEEDDCVENGQSMFWLINAWLGDIDWATFDFILQMVGDEEAFV